jgi:hypothetical protein
VGETIISQGAFNSREISASGALLGVATRSTGRYASIDLDLMTGPHFDASPLTNRALNLEKFTPEGLNVPMLVARRAARALNLADPVLAPWLADTSVRADGPPRPRVGLVERWRSSSYGTTLVVLGVAAAAGVALLASSDQAHVVVTCRSPSYLRDSAPTFGFTCTGRQVLSFDAGRAKLGIWDSSRACWILRELILPEKGRMTIDLDDVVKTSTCADTSWPPPSLDEAQVKK